MTTRRNFLTRGVAATAGLIGLPALATGAGSPGSGADHEAWLDRLTGGDLDLFDSPVPADGRMLHLIQHYYDTYRMAYGAPEGSYSAIGTFYGETTAFAFRDEVWAKYRLGEVAEVSDPATGQGAIRNPWRVDPVIRGKVDPGAGLEALQARGAVFLVCHAALRSLAARVAADRGPDRAVVTAALESGILPGVVLVPSVIVAIQRAQKRGVSYYRIG